MKNKNFFDIKSIINLMSINYLHAVINDIELKQLDFIDEMHGSTSINLKGQNKLDYIVSKWGNNFDYLGDSKSDNIIFKSARNGFLVTSNKLIHVKK